MRAAPKPRWRRLRWWFRVCRLGVLVVLLALLAGFIYLNQVGVPNVVTARLQAELQGRGVDFQFERLRLNPFRGFVADAVTVGATGRVMGAQVRFGELALLPDTRALSRCQFRVAVLALDQGRLTLPLPAADQPTEWLTLTNVSARIRFLAGDLWEIDSFQAHFLGARLQGFGAVTNASALRPWIQPGGFTRAVSTARVWQDDLRRFLLLCRQASFVHPPNFFLKFHGDAAVPTSFYANLRCQAAGADTPWGSLANLELALGLNEPPSTNGWFRVALALEVGTFSNRWVTLHQASLNAVTAQAATNAHPEGVDWRLAASGLTAKPEAKAEATASLGGPARLLTLQTARVTGHSVPLPDEPSHWRTDLGLVAGSPAGYGAKAQGAKFDGFLRHSLTNWLPDLVEGVLGLTRFESPWATAQTVQLALRGAGGLTEGPEPPADGGPWRRWSPWTLTGQAQLTNLAALGLRIPVLSFGADWRSGRLEVTNLQAALLGGQVTVPAARLDMQTRELRAQLRASLEVPELVSWALTNPPPWLAELACPLPPRLEGQFQLVLPPWTERPADWATAVLDTLVGDGHLEAERPSFRGFTAESLATEVHWSNRVGRLEHLVLRRPEGAAEMDLELDARDRAYQAQVRLQIDPAALAPAVGRTGQSGLGLFRFTQPPQIEGSICGRLSPAAITGAAGTVAANRFTFREFLVDSFAASISYTNRFLLATNVHLARGEEWIGAPAVGLSLVDYFVYLTNAQSRIDPMVVAQAIGSKTARTIGPYRYERPPHALVNGYVPAVGSESLARMRFELDGGPFRYWRFAADHLQATVLWNGEDVRITNLLSTNFYAGQLGGDMGLDCTPKDRVWFSFRAGVTNLDFHRFTSDIKTNASTLEATNAATGGRGRSQEPNRLSGLLTGRLSITSADSEDWGSWQGYGSAELREGFLWDFPLFGIFSSILNTVAPGAGNSRVSAAKARYTIENSIIRTDSLEIRAPPVRLQYRGTVNFEGELEARVEAEVLRGAPLIGPVLKLVLSPVTKVFEYRVFGTLADPKTEPMYIPKFLDSLFHPFRTLKKLLPIQPDSQPEKTPIPSRK